MSRHTCLVAAAGWLIFTAGESACAQNTPPAETKQTPPQNAPAAPPKKGAPAKKLQPESRLQIVRYLWGEFARAVRPLPTGKNGVRVKVGHPVDEKALRQAAAQGVAGNPGDSVQVTHVEFRDKEIILDINGGGKKRTHWRDRIQISAGGPMPTSRVEQVGGPAGFQGIGATLILDFGWPVPDMTPEELKAHLAGFLDFSKQRSAAVQWVETLAPEFQQAIKDKRAVVGMDREMVIAALGRPERKVREKDEDGVEKEDWIYGHPPAKTVFVTFAGEKVIGVKQYPQ